MHPGSFRNFKAAPTEGEKKAVAERLYSHYVGDRSIFLDQHEVLALVTAIKDRERQAVLLESRIQKLETELGKVTLSVIHSKRQ